MYFLHLFFKFMKNKGFVKENLYLKNLNVLVAITTPNSSLFLEFMYSISFLISVIILIKSGKIIAL